MFAAPTRRGQGTLHGRMKGGHSRNMSIPSFGRWYTAAGMMTDTSCAQQSGYNSNEALGRPSVQRELRITDLYGESDATHEIQLSSHPPTSAHSHHENPQCFNRRPLRPPCLRGFPLDIQQNAFWEQPYRIPATVHSNSRPINVVAAGLQFTLNGAGRS